MVRLARLGAALALPLLASAQFAQLQALQDKGQDLIKYGLAKVLRFNDTQIEKLMTKVDATLPPHEHAVDLTDDNWEAVLRTGTEDPHAPELPEDTIWIVTMYGSDQISQMFAKALDDVATYNSSAAGGELPPNIRFARLNYGFETKLPTRWWVWKVPLFVIATDQGRTLRFIKFGAIPPQVVPVSHFLADRDWWTRVKPWTGRLAPGGYLAPYLIPLGNAWAAYHKRLSKIPSIVLMMLSGALMNFVIGWFHKKPAAARIASANTPTDRPKAQAEPATTPATAHGSSSGVKKDGGKATKRK